MPTLNQCESYGGDCEQLPQSALHTYLFWMTPSIEVISKKNLGQHVNDVLGNVTERHQAPCHHCSLALSPASLFTQPSGR